MNRLQMGKSGGDQLIDELAIQIMNRMGKGMKGVGFKHDASGVGVSTGFMHGPGGLLSMPGVDPDVWSTVVGPLNSIMGRMPTKPSLYVSPTYATITGITSDDVRAGIADEPDEPCDDAPQAGQRSTCYTWAPFGFIKRGTKEIDIATLGRLNDRADPIDLNLVNTPIGDSLFTGSQAQFGFTAQSLVNEMLARFQDRAISLYLKLSQLAWTGTPANNHGEGYMEFVGLERLIATGYKDAQTGALCPSLDSDIKDAGHAHVETDTTKIINLMTYLMRYVRGLATRAGALPVTWVWAMREELFYELTKFWPISYFLGSMTVNQAGGQVLNYNADAAVNMRDQMRQGRYLVIDGMQIDVVFDDAIPYSDGNQTGGHFPSGCLESDIYLLPLSARGRSTLFIEYFQYDNPSVQTVLGRQVLANVDGAFLETPRQTNTCVVFDAQIRPRIVLRTPWLAGKIQNVVYCPTQIVRSAFPDDPYAVGGGVTNRSGPSYHSPTGWNTGTERDN
jgi:hypothetical protein